MAPPRGGKMAEGAGSVAARLAALGTGLDLRTRLARRGYVASVGDGIAIVLGVGDAGYQELVAFDSGALGMVNDLQGDAAGVVLLSGAERVRAGEGVVASGAQPTVRVPEALAGRVIDPLGRPLDGGPPSGGAEVPVFREAPRLMERSPVVRPLVSGVMAIDAAIPIGRGQRQLIIGDRNVGKTALALDVIAAQTGGDVVCVYALIGQSTSRELAVKEALGKAGALAHTVVVAADASMAPGMQFLAPYAAASVAESFRDAGRDALVVYDDLTKHADVYRELALLLDRPPGREAYPADIFHVHAELLERAAPRCDAAGGGSVTALPIIETTDGEISAYIPTNLVSITDGQIYLDTARFERNQRPAIDVGRSVSRIGGAAQPPALRAVARNLRIELSRFEGLEAFTRVGLDVDPETARTVRRGLLLRELLRQGPLSPRTVGEQVVLLHGAGDERIEGLQPRAARRVLLRAAQIARAEESAVLGVLDRGEQPEGWEEAVTRAVQRAADEAG